VCTGSVATRFHITKYPTLKVIRNGQPTKREYRGQRSAEAFLSFIQKQLADPIKEFADLKELKDLDVSFFFFSLCEIVMRFYVFIRNGQSPEY
jgi:hypothetical protein